MFSRKFKIIKQRWQAEKLSLFNILIAFLVAAAFLVYYYSNSQPENHFDYTFRVAENFWRGAIGITDKPPSWLNEFVLFDGKYYSVFPLGSVLTMMPFAVFKVFGFIDAMPAAFVAATTAGLICLFLLLIAGKYDYGCDKLIKRMGWTAIFVLTFLLWIHGNAGGWQFGYRYAMILLPWIYLILLENSPRKITPIEWAAYGFSFAVNAFSIYLFHWSDYIKP